MFQRLFVSWKAQLVSYICMLDLWLVEMGKVGLVLCVSLNACLQACQLKYCHYCMYDKSNCWRLFVFTEPIQNPEQEKVRKALPHKQAVISISPQEWQVGHLLLLQKWRTVSLFIRNIMTWNNMKFRDTAFREYLPVSREIVIVSLETI